MNVTFVVILRAFGKCSDRKQKFVSTAAKCVRQNDYRRPSLSCQVVNTYKLEIIDGARMVNKIFEAFIHIKYVDTFRLRTWQRIFRNKKKRHVRHYLQVSKKYRIFFNALFSMITSAMRGG